jgi:hypothetical protein
MALPAIGLADRMRSEGTENALFVKIMLDTFTQLYLHSSCWLVPVPTSAGESLRPALFCNRVRPFMGFCCARPLIDLCAAKATCGRARLLPSPGAIRAGINRCPKACLPHAEGRIPPPHFALPAIGAQPRPPDRQRPRSCEVLASSPVGSAGSKTPEHGRTFSTNTGDRSCPVLFSTNDRSPAGWGRFECPPRTMPA